MKAVKRGKKIYEIILDELKVLIESDNLQPGDKLPTERELIEILNVGRSSLREALIALENEGYIEIIQGKGIFIKDRNTSLLQDIDIINVDQMLDYLQETRCVLECEIVQLACLRATEEDKRNMQVALEQMLQETTNMNLKDRVRADYEFHYSIAKAAKNPILHDLLKQMDEKLYSGRSTTLTFPKGREKAIKAHSKIYEAICNKDLALAEEEMRKHIQEISASQKYILALKKKEKEV